MRSSTVRRRRRAFVGVFAVLALAVALVPAFPRAANADEPTPLLTGEKLWYAPGAGGGTTPTTGTLSGSLDCDAGQLHAQIHGTSSSGPYVGPYTEQLDIQFSGGQLTSFDLSFDVDAGATTVEGAISFNDAINVQCGPRDQDEPETIAFWLGARFETLLMDYTANVVAPDGTTSETGVVQVKLAFEGDASNLAGDRQLFLTFGEPAPPPPPPTAPALDGERLIVSNSMGDQNPIDGTTAGSFSCGATSELNVTVTGHAYGPYPGTFSQTIYARLVDGYVDAFDTTFEIYSDDGAIVSGDAHYSGSLDPGICSTFIDVDDDYGAGPGTSINRFGVGAGGSGFDAIPLSYTATVDDGSGSNDLDGLINGGVNFFCYFSSTFTSNCDVATTVLRFVADAGPTPTPSPSSPPDLTGYVTYADSGVESIPLQLCPMSDIYQSCMSTTTLEDGSYSFYDVPSEQMWILKVVVIDGYHVIYDRAGFLDLSGGQVAHDFALATGELYGTVLDTDGNPVEGAQVCATGYNEPYGPCNAAFTEADGAYLIPYLFADDYSVHVYIPGYDLVTVDPITIGGTQVEQNFTLTAHAPSGGVFGFVTSNGTPVEGVEIHACGAFGCAAPTGLTDAQGTYQIDNIPVGTVTLVVNFPDNGGRVIADPAGAIDVIDGSYVSHDVVLPSGGLQGHVLDPNFNVVTNSGVEACRVDNGLCGFVPTDSEGFYFFPYMTPGDYTLTAVQGDADHVRTPQVGASTIGTTVLTRDVTLNFSVPLTGLAGSVTGTAGAVGGVTVWACGAVCPSTVTGADGSFSFPELPDGSYYLSVVSNGQAFQDPANPVTVSGPTHHDINLPSGAMTGLVTDSDGAAVPGAWVNLCDPDYHCRGDAADSDGVYRIEFVHPGDYSVEIYPPDNQHLTTLGLPPASIGTAIVVRDLEIDRPISLPTDGTVTLSGDGEIHADAGSVPHVWPNGPLHVRTTGCPGGTASYTTANYLYPGFDASGLLGETAPGVYEGTLDLVGTGLKIVTLSINCPPPIADEITSFHMYVDPSGFVRNTFGHAITGATVTLYRADVSVGPWEAVPDGSAIMSPSNTMNPDTTDVVGHFGWDVVPGFYKVRAEKAGCYDPANEANTFVESQVYEIPPPVLDIDLVLYCGESTYDFSGFFSPVGPGLNKHTAGSTVPLKFTLGEVTALEVLAAGSPTSVQVDCHSLQEIGTVTSPVGGLTFADGQYKFEWQTSKAWAGTCRQFVLTLDDGSVHTAYFDFRKK